MDKAITNTVGHSRLDLIGVAFKTKILLFILSFTVGGLLLTYGNTQLQKDCSELNSNEINSWQTATDREKTFTSNSQIGIIHLQKNKTLMSVKVEASIIIERPVAVVFEFYAYNHVINHPRWDPDIKLEQISEGPIGVGTLIKRQNSRSGKLVEGTMEVVDFVPNQSFGVVIHDGPVEMNGRVVFEPITNEQTKITISAEIPGMDASTDMSFMKSRMERSCLNIKNLIASETKK